MATRRSSALALAYAPDGRRQSAIGTALLSALLTAAMPVTSRNYPDVTENVEEIFDCTGEEILDELVTRRIARLSIEFDVSAKFLAWLTAFGFGVAASPSGGAAANEVQTITIDATGGTFTITVPTYDGLPAGTTPALAWNASAATVRAALEAIVGEGNVAVSLASLVYTITFQNDLASFNMPALTTNAALLTGGASTAVVATTTPGTNYSQAISRIGVGTYQGPLTSIIVGFRGSSRDPVMWRDVGVNSFEVNWRAGEKVTGRAELVGNADLVAVPGFTLPNCEDVTAIRASQVRLTHDGVIIPNRAGQLTYSNEFLTGDNPYTTDDIDIQNLERADRRRQAISYQVLGEPGDALYVAAQARTVVALGLRIGRAGDNVLYQTPTSRTVFDTPRLGFEGEARSSQIRLRNLLYKQSGNSATPINAVANVNQSTAFLLP